MFDVIFRLWNIGTHRLFTWADPDYARRFSQTVGLGNRGFQITSVQLAKLFRELADFHAQKCEPLLVRLKLSDPDSGWRDGATLHYRRTDMTEGAFRATEMQWNGASFSAAIPSEYLTPEQDIMVYFSGHNSDSQTLLYPDLFNPDHPAPYFIVEIEE